MRTFWLERAWTRVTPNYYCNPFLGSSSFFPASRSMHSCRRPISGLHEYNPAKTSAAAASSPILRAALSRSLAKGWLEMSILRQSEQSSNSSQEIPQSVGRRLRGKPNHVVFGLSWENTFRFSVRFVRHQWFLPPQLCTSLRCADLASSAKARRRCNFA